MVASLDRVADVVVLPFGRVPTLLYSRAVLDRLEAWGASGGRTGRGVVVVAAAGNANCPLHYRGGASVIYQVDPSTGETLTFRTFRNALTRVQGLLHVAAVTEPGQRAPYSGYGPGVDLCAPSMTACRGPRRRPGRASRRRMPSGADHPPVQGHFGGGGTRGRGGGVGTGRNARAYGPRRGGAAVPHRVEDAGPDAAPGFPMDGPPERLVSEPPQQVGRAHQLSERDEGVSEA